MNNQECSENAMIQLIANNNFAIQLHQSRKEKSETTEKNLNYFSYIVVRAQLRIFQRKFDIFCLILNTIRMNRRTRIRTRLFVTGTVDQLFSFCCLQSVPCQYIVDKKKSRDQHGRHNATEFGWKTDKCRRHCEWFLRCASESSIAFFIHIYCATKGGFGVAAKKLSHCVRAAEPFGKIKMFQRFGISCCWCVRSVCT